MDYEITENFIYHEITESEYKILKNTFIRVVYNKDKVLEFERIFYDLRMSLKDTDVKGIYFLGYKYTCPSCERRSMVRNSMHEVSFFDDEKCKMTVMPSIVCPYSDCNWHVYIKHGVAKDC